MTAIDDRIAEIEAAPDAEESLRERVARAVFGFMPPISYNLRLAMARDAADAAITVVTTPALEPAPPDRSAS